MKISKSTAIAAIVLVLWFILSWVLGLGAWFMGANLSLQYGAARLRASTTAVVMVSEVVFASVSAVALGAATLQAQTLAGGLLIGAAALLATWQEGQRDRA